MSANVLDMIINDATAGNVWWENGKRGGVDGTSRIDLAKRIKGEETADEIISLLKWEWTPDTARLVNPKTEEQVDAYQVFRSDNKESLGIVISEKGIGVPPSPREIVEWMSQAREKLGAMWNTLGETTTSKIWAQIAIDTPVDMGNGDLVENRLIMAYNYKQRSGNVKVCVTNVVCENTLCMALSEKQNGRVDYDFSSLDDAAITKLGKKLGIARQKFAQTVDTYKRLQDRSVDLSIHSREIATFAYMLDNSQTLSDVVTKYEHDPTEGMEAVQMLLKGHTSRRLMEMGAVGKNVLAAIVGGIGQDLDARKDNWYGAFQGCTYYYDNVAGRSEQTRLDSAYFGQNAERKEQALQAAVLMSEVAR